ncbi:hypothetical protein QBC37DRAFT_122081 [Rhypophila decipiens]|uniref:C2H2-type domain-containing protein n=1 Tax=Rhypophila decipiens TaxID=261697 RepID=A0AAN7BC65_9PEZI|nr:hypothetical protein QBC37DRAFT_122081 [Rhypophila decipiens]
MRGWNDAYHEGRNKGTCPNVLCSSCIRWPTDDEIEIFTLLVDELRERKDEWAQIAYGSGTGRKKPLIGTDTVRECVHGDNSSASDSDSDNQSFWSASEDVADTMASGSEGDIGTYKCPKTWSSRESSKEVMRGETASTASSTGKAKDAMGDVPYAGSEWRNNGRNDRRAEHIRVNNWFQERVTKEPEATESIKNSKSGEFGSSASPVDVFHYDENGSLLLGEKPLNTNHNHAGDPTPCQAKHGSESREENKNEMESDSCSSETVDGATLENMFSVDLKVEFVQYIVRQFPTSEFGQDSGQRVEDISSLRETQTPATYRRVRQQQRSQNPRNRTTSHNGEGDEDEENDVPCPPLGESDTDSDGKLLACPYYKWKPLTHRSCQKKVLKEINRLKAHLWRCHEPPIHCPICFDEFQTEQSRDTHLRARSCSLKKAPDWDTITADQKSKIKRRADPKKSRVEHWFDIFRILFPGHPIPCSPFVDILLSNELCNLRNFIARSWRPIFDAQAEQRLPECLRTHTEAVQEFSHAVFEDTVSVLLDLFERSRQGSGVSVTSDPIEASVQDSGSLVWSETSAVEPRGSSSVTSVMTASQAVSSQLHLLEATTEQTELGLELGRYNPHISQPDSTGVIGNTGHGFDSFTAEGMDIDFNNLVQFNFPLKVALCKHYYIAFGVKSHRLAKPPTKIPAMFIGQIIHLPIGRLLSESSNLTTDEVILWRLVKKASAALPHSTPTLTSLHASPTVVPINTDKITATLSQTHETGLLNLNAIVTTGSTGPLIPFSMSICGSSTAHPLETSMYDLERYI